MDKFILWRPPQVHHPTRGIAIFSTSGCQEHGDFCLPPLLCAGPSLITLQALQMCWTGCEPMYCYDVCKPVPHAGHSRYSDVVYFTGNTLRYRLRACVMKLGFLDVFSSYIHKHKALPSNPPLPSLICGSLLFAVIVDDKYHCSAS